MSYACILYYYYFQQKVRAENWHWGCSYTHTSLKNKGFSSAHDIFQHHYSNLFFTSKVFVYQDGACCITVILHESAFAIY